MQGVEQSWASKVSFHTCGAGFVCDLAEQSRVSKAVLSTHYFRGIKRVNRWQLLPGTAVCPGETNISGTLYRGSKGLTGGSCCHIDQERRTSAGPLYRGSKGLTGGSCRQVLLSAQERPTSAGRCTQPGVDDDAALDLGRYRHGGLVVKASAS